MVVRNWKRNEIETSVHKIPERERAAGRRLLHSRRLWSRNNSQWLVPRCLPNSVSPPRCPPFFSSSSSSLPQRRCEPPVPQHLSTHLIVRPLLSNTHNGIFLFIETHACLPSLALPSSTACMCATPLWETTLPLTWTAVCARQTARPAGCYFAPFTASSLDYCGEKEAEPLEKIGRAWAEGKCARQVCRFGNF